MTRQRAFYLASQVVLTPFVLVLFGVAHFVVFANLVFACPPLVYKEPSVHPSKIVRGLAGVSLAFYVCILLAPALAACSLWFSTEHLGPLDFFFFPVSLFGIRAAYYYVFGFGAITVVYGAVYLIKEGLWQRLQSHQPLNLPTSKARSAAIGLAEFKGVARAVKGESDPILELYLGGPSSHKETIHPFYLEDDTGRILIDPRGASIQPEWQSNLTLGAREIVLTRRVEPATHTTAEVRTLLSGDPVFVVGNVQERPDVRPNAVGSERLVVKPLEPTVTSRATSLLKRYDIPQAFYLTDAGEPVAVTQMRKGIARVVFLSLIYIASGVVLLRAGYGKAFEGYAHWTPAEVYLERSWIGDLGEAQRAEVLVEKLDSVDPDVRNDALRYLSLNEERGAVDARVALLLADEDARVRERARGWFEDVESWPKADYAAALGSAATHPDEWTRAFAVASVDNAGIPEEDAASILLDALADPSAPVREAAATEAFPYVNARRDWTVRLFPLLNDLESDVAQAAYTSLDQDQLPPPDAADFLVGTLDSESPREQAMALWLLHRMGAHPGEVRDAARKRLHASSPEVAFAAVRVSAAPSSESVAVLRRILTDTRTTPRVRGDAVRELRRHEDAATDAVPELVALLEEGVSEPATFETLAKLGPAAAPAIPYALYYLKSTTLSVRRNYALFMLRSVGPHGATYLEDILDVLRTHRMEDSRRTAAIWLGNMGPDAAPALGLLQELADGDPDESVQTTCREAVTKIEGQ